MKNMKNMKNHGGTGQGRDSRAARLAGSDRPLESASEYARLLELTLRDLLTGQMTPQAANAAGNLTGKVIRLAELQYRYGTQQLVRRLLPPLSGKRRRADAAKKEV